MGYTYKTGGMLATFLGGIIGGYLSRQASVKRGVQVTILIQLIATSMFIGIQALPVASAAHLSLITLAMYMESLSIGTSTTMITIIITKNCRSILLRRNMLFLPQSSHGSGV